MFERDIRPLLQTLPLSILARKTGLTRGYLGQIRAGKKNPHLRRWEALRSITDSYDHGPSQPL